MAYQPTSADISNPSSNGTSGYQPVSADINQNSSPQEASTFMGKMPAVKTPQEALNNMGMSLHNTHPSLKNLAKGAGYALMLTPGLGELAGAAEVGAPLMAKTIPYAANAIGRIGVGSTGGALANTPNQNNLSDFSKDFGKNALLNAGIEGIPLGGMLAKEGINRLNPQKYAEKFINSIGGGRDLEENGKYIANSIKNKYNEIKDNFRQRYDNIFNNSGNLASNPIYNRIDPIVGTYKPTEFEKLDLEPEDFKNKAIYNQYTDFLKDPTLEKAHDLQSDLGSHANRLGRSSDPDYDAINSLNNARNLLKKDIHSYLGSTDKNTLNEYKQVSNDYKNELIPYQKGKIGDISSGDITNPTQAQITSLFRNPEPNVSKVLSHQEPGFKDSILYNLLGQEPGAVSINEINKNIKNFGKKGINTYRTPESKEIISNINKRHLSSSALKSLGQAGLGYGIGALLGSPTIEGAAAMAGGILHPFNYLNNVKHLLPEIKPEIKNAITKAYRPTSRIAGANALANK